MKERGPYFNSEKPQKASGEKCPSMKAACSSLDSDLGRDSLEQEAKSLPLKDREGNKISGAKSLDTK